MELELEILQPKSHRKGSPTISVSLTGLVSISAAATHTIGIEDGTLSAIAKDKKNTDDWYLILFREKDAPGIPLRNNKNGGSCINSFNYVKEFFGHFQDNIHDEKSIRLPLATKGTEILEGKATAYAIITKALSNG
jgi:hypothetical protein